MLPEHKAEVPPHRQILQGSQSRRQVLNQNCPHVVHNPRGKISWTIKAYIPPVEKIFYCFQTSPTFLQQTSAKARKVKQKISQSLILAFLLYKHKKQNKNNQVYFGRVCLMIFISFTDLLFLSQKPKKK